MQEPLHEFSSLMASEDEEILALKMHSLQDSLPKVGCVTVSRVMNSYTQDIIVMQRNCIHVYVHVWIGYTDSCSFKCTLFPIPSPFQISVHFSPLPTLFLFIPLSHPSSSSSSSLPSLLFLFLLPPPISSSSLLPSLLSSSPCCLRLLVYLIGPTKTVSGDRAGKPCK